MVLTVAPSQVLNCQTLQTLDLSKNRIQSITGIGNLINLKCLNLSSNRLDYLPDDIVLCSKLIEFKCYNNLLTARSFPLNFNDLSALMYLNISDNKMDELTHGLVQLALSISTVFIHDNQWTDSRLVAITDSTPMDSVKKIVGTVYDVRYD